MAWDMKRYENVLRKQTGKAIRPARFDGYANLINRYGTAKDDTEQYYYKPEPPIDDIILEMFYENNGLFARIIDTPAEEAVKHGFTLEGIEDDELTDFYQSAIDELDWEDVAMTGIKWARLFGGSLAVMLINDGHGLDEPVDWRHIKSIDDIVVYDRSMISPDRSSMYAYDADDPFRTRGSRLGTPEWYDISAPTGNFRVHDSRCLVFRNGVLPLNALNEIYQFWGIPEYVRISRAVRNAEIAHESAPKMLSKSVQPIYKMKDLAMELATEEGEDKVLRRLQIIDMARGLLNSIAIDSEGEDYSFQSFGFNGVSDVIESSCNWLSALTNIPQTILFGRSPAGMNATGHSDFENYYNYIERIQKRMLRANLRYLLAIIFTAGKHTGEIKEVPDRVDVQFNPLWSLDETEEAQLETAKLQNEQLRATVSQAYIEMGVIDPKEVRVELGKEDPVDPETMLDDMTEEELLESMPEPPQGGEGGEGGMGGMMGGGMPPMPQEGAEEAQQAGPEAAATPVPEDYAEQGNSPETAPEATKLPQDMNPEDEPDHEDAEGEETKDEGLDWITVNGAHIPLDPNGKALAGGELKGKDLSEAETEKPQSKADTTIKEVPRDVFPEEGSKRFNPYSGWNNERKEYLNKNGYNSADADAFDDLIKRHIQGDDVREEIEDFVNEHKDLVRAVASFEVAAAPLRAETQKKEADKKIKRYELQLEDIDNRVGLYGTCSDNDLELYKEDAIRGLAEAKRERDELDKPVQVYRKGEYDSPVLSFTTNSSGVTLYEGTDHEERLIPDHRETVEGLMEKGIFPIGGFGATFNYYAGEGSEVTFVKIGGSDNDTEGPQNGSPKRSVKQADPVPREKYEETQKLKDDYASEVAQINKSAMEKMNAPGEVDYSSIMKEQYAALKAAKEKFDNRVKSLDEKYKIDAPDPDHEDEDEDNTQDPGGLIKRWATPEYQPPLPLPGDEETTGWLVKDFDTIMSFVPDEGVSSPEWLDDEIKRRIRAVGVLVVDKNGKILTGTRKGGDGENFDLLGGPGGHVEPHESLEDAAIRETYEEFGIVAKNLTFVSLGDYEEDSGMIPAIFLCTEWAGTLHPVDGEMENLRFRTIDDILSHKLFVPFKTSLEILEKELTFEVENGIMAMDEFVEGDHPRAENGQFTSGGGSSPESKTETEEAEPEAPVKPKPSAKGKNIPPLGFEHKKTALWKLRKHKDHFPGWTYEQINNRAIDLLSQPCEGDIDGYLLADGAIARFDKSNGEFAVGYPGGYVKSIYNLGFSTSGNFDINRAIRRFNDNEKADGVPDGT